MVPITKRSQTELSMNTHVVVSDIRRDVVTTHTMVSNVHQDVTNTHSVVSELCHNVADTHTIVSDIHRAIVVNQEGNDGKDLSVSVTCIRFIAESTLTTV